MITGECIISYPAVFKPAPNPSGQMKFSCSLLISKDDKASVEALRAAVDKAVLRGKEKWGGKVPKFRYEPIRDGDAELATGEKTDGIYKNKYFINASGDTAPGVVDKYAKPLLDQSLLYAGCIVRADVNPFPYKNGGNCGVGWGLNNIMLVRDGQRLDGRQNAEDAFAGFADAETGNEAELM